MPHGIRKQHHLIDMNKTLIVTGATGFVGSHLIPVLRKKGYRLLLLTRKRKFETDDPLIIQCDISEESDVAEHLFSTYSPVGIIFTWQPVLFPRTHRHKYRKSLKATLHSVQKYWILQ